ncbi:hypothetical protein M405DRAFT_831697 [Rhizopogon salebrosus TDB-379]|nr:hypothetical protein M405DRAFT_831697 [Rhizopogon salebrosus TDB-379]
MKTVSTSCLFQIMQHFSALWHGSLVSHSQVTAGSSLIDTDATWPSAEVEDARRLPQGVFDNARDGIHPTVAILGPLQTTNAVLSHPFRIRCTCTP